MEADVSWPTHTMAAADYEELERLFHSDLQTLDLQVRLLCCIYGGVLPRVGFKKKKKKKMLIGCSSFLRSGWRGAWGLCFCFLFRRLDVIS